MRYVSLHHHSTYSYMDGYGLPDAHVKRAAELGMSALALTEHGNVSSHVKLELAAKEAGIKPIFGLEAYTAPSNMRETANMRKWHQTILAMNETGLYNLYQLVSRSWDEGFYRWPTIHWEWLVEHNEGLIVTSGCADSLLSCSLLGGKGIEDPSLRRAEGVVRAYSEVFGDRYYIETQRFPQLKRTRDLNPQFQDWSDKYGIPLVATSDCHYPLPTDNEMQKILHAAGRNTGTVAAAEAEWEYDILLTFPLSDREIHDDLVATGLSEWHADEAIASTVEIAERCNVELPKMDRVRYPVEQEAIYVAGMTTETMLRKWLNDGWYYRGFDKLPKAQQQEAKARCEYEFALFRDKDFLDYFAMLSDAVRYCKDNFIPVGPARGSAAASLCCYLWRIIEVNPMQYPLMLFERFVDPNRNDLPDVDLDFDDELRDGVRQHLISRYGEDRVGNIGTYTRYRGKNSLDDVGKVYRVPKWVVENVKEFLVERSGGDSRFDASIEDTVEMFPQVKALFDEYPDLYRAIALEGNYKGFGVHAAGLVVGADKLDHYVATYTRHKVGKSKKSVRVLSVDKYDGEPLGLLKLDALGLSTMGMIRNALEMIDMSLEDLYNIPMDDAVTMKAFEVADVLGIFQFDGRTMRMVCQEMRPKTFMDLAAINALARPGPLHSGSTGDYLAIRHGRMERVDIHPLLTEICSDTEGQIIYQEQILQICRVIGKFPWTHASAIRKIISNKKGESAFNAMWDDFRRGAAENGVTEEVAREIWKRMATAGTYAFNIAHCISYSMLGFWSQWLKQHHTEAFFAAQLRKADEAKAVSLMRDAQDPRYGRLIQVYPPQLDSGRTWTRGKGAVYAGFEQIPGIGESNANAILKTRGENGGFGSWEELLTVPGIGPKKMEHLQEFSESEDPFGINWLRDKTEEIRHLCRAEGLPAPNTLSDEIPYDAKVSKHVLLGIVHSRNLKDLFEDHRSRTGEDLDPQTVDRPDLKDSLTLYMEDTAGMMTVKINRWNYPRMRAKLWDIKLGHDFVLIVGQKSAFYGKTVQAKDIWVIDPD